MPPSSRSAAKIARAISVLLLPIKPGMPRISPAWTSKGDLFTFLLNCKSFPPVRLPSPPSAYPWKRNAVGGGDTVFMLMSCSELISLGRNGADGTPVLKDCDGIGDLKSLS